MLCFKSFYQEFYFSLFFCQFSIFSASILALVFDNCLDKFGIMFGSFLHIFFAAFSVSNFALIFDAILHQFWRPFGSILMHFGTIFCIQSRPWRSDRFRNRCLVDLEQFWHRFEYICSWLLMDFWQICYWSLFVFGMIPNICLVAFFLTKSNVKKRRLTKIKETSRN